jgi:hypothetical protein
MLDNQICFLCETWLESYDKEIETEWNKLGLTMSSRSAMNIMRNAGRPYGGVAWLYYQELNDVVKIEHITNNISTCILKASPKEIKIIGVYMPTNDIKQFREDIQLLENLIKKEDDKHFIILGDFNSCTYRSHQYNNVQRGTSTRMTNIVNKTRMSRYPWDIELERFVKKQKLMVVSNLYLQNTYNTFKSGDRSSRIDHVIIKEHDEIPIVTVNVITKCNCKMSCWEKDNLSDHRAINIDIVTKLKTMANREPTNESVNLEVKPKNKIKINWKCEFNLLRYQNHLDNTLIETNIAATAFNTSCMPTNNSLRSLIDHLHTAILLSKEKASINANKQKYSQKNDMIPEVTEQIKNKSIWHKDKSDEANEIKRYFRANQRKLQRKSASDKINKISNTLCEYFKEQNRTKFWNTIKTVSKNKSTIDIAIKDLETYYDKALNESEIESQLNMQSIAQSINTKLEQINYDGTIELTYETLDHLLWQLKSNKARGITGIENECFKYSNHNTMIPLIKLILETIINKRIKVSEMNTGLLIPIIKDSKASNNDINNVRPITLSDTLAILMEQIILIILKKFTALHELQFGFTENNSTQHAIFVLRETILDSLVKKEKLYLCFMDFSKAFDKLNKTLLMAKLNNKINDLMWLTIYNYITAARIVIKNNNSASKYIEVQRGVKQGGPASPHMFAYYIDEMIRQVVRIGIVCALYNIVIGIICYADDTTIAAKTIEALQATVDLITNYCRNHEIKINESKTKWMLVGTKKQRDEDNSNLMINGIIVERVNRFKFLGYWVNEISKEEDHINIRMEKSRNTTYALNKIGFLNYKMKYDIKGFLYCAYGRATLKYGFENTYFTQTHLKKIRTQECLLLKRALMLPKNVSNTKLLKALDINDIEDAVKIRKLKFVKQLMNNRLTARIITAQIATIESAHKHSLIRDVVENYLAKPLHDVNSTNKLLELIEYEIDQNNKIEDLAEKEETENVRYLLGHRNKLNNLTLINILQKGYG